MRSDDLAAINAVAGRVGAGVVLEMVLDDMPSSKLRSIAKLLAVKYETPDDWAMSTLSIMMDESAARELIERARATGEDVSTGQQLLAACLRVRTES